MKFAEIAIPRPLSNTFTYVAQDGVIPLPGSRTIVVFCKRQVVGICLALHKDAPRYLEMERLKPIEAILDEEPVFSQPMLKLLKWISQYYLTPIGEVCRAALPSRLMEIGAPRTLRPTAPVELYPIPEKHFELNKDQKQTLASILNEAGCSRPKPVLLHGITGSGKTEIYLSLFAELAKKEKQSLLLVPEIGLTPQLTGRAVSRFGKRVAIYHSGLTNAQRHDQWQRMRTGHVDVVIGTRSALFSPLPNLGAIVIDEEHDSSFKQDEGVIYHARDAAVMRAHIEGIPIILGSATPSLESFANAKHGKYLYHVLPERPGGASLPSVEIVDMRNCRRGEFTSLSPRLYDAIKETIERKEQALLYMGRRGFASSVQCQSCGMVLLCPNCDVSLTLHRRTVGGRSETETLTCHYCDYKIQMPNTCRECKTGELLPIGHGTERLEAEILDFFPNARVARLDSDTISSPTKRQRTLGEMRTGKIDILIGTQMVTKGHDFPHITLVGVVSADTMLYLPDFRSAERTFQIITQVAGRAGRAAKAGKVIVQTRQPGHYCLETSCRHDFGSFAATEMGHRKGLGYPPHTRIANIRLASNHGPVVAKAADKAVMTLKEVRSSAGEFSNIAILGPAPAPIGRLRGRTRWQILLKAPTATTLTKYLSLACKKLEEGLPSRVRLTIDVDPLNLL